MARHRARWKKRGKLVVFTGGRWMAKIKGRGMTDINGIDDLLEAFSRIARSRHDVSLLILGVHDERLRSESKRLGIEDRVIIGGPFSYLEEKHIAALALADCLVIPGKKSWRHSYCDRAKFCEYMMAGKPVVAADFKPVREAFGSDAIYYEPEDIGQLSREIMEVLDGRRRKAVSIGDLTFQKREGALLGWLGRL